MRFKLWLENQEVKDQIKDQLASAMKMQDQKATFGSLPLDSLRPTVIKALKDSEGWMRDHIPNKDKWLGAEKWVQMAQGKRVQDLIEYLAGEEQAIPNMSKQQARAQQPQQPPPGAPQPPMPVPGQAAAPSPTPGAPPVVPTQG